MEDTLREYNGRLCGYVRHVLILVLMEDTLRESKTYESFVEAGLVFIRPIVPALVNRNQLLSKRMQR